MLLSPRRRKTRPVSCGASSEGWGWGSQPTVGRCPGVRVVCGCRIVSCNGTLMLIDVCGHRAWAWFGLPLATSSTATTPANLTNDLARSLCWPPSFCCTPRSRCGWCIFVGRLDIRWGRGAGYRKHHRLRRHDDRGVVVVLASSLPLLSPSPKCPSVPIVPVSSVPVSSVPVLCVSISVGCV